MTSIPTSRTGLPAGRAPGIEQRRVVLTWLPGRGAGTVRRGRVPAGAALRRAAAHLLPERRRTIKIDFQQPQPRVFDPDDHHPYVEPGYALPWAAAVADRIAGMREHPVRIESYVEGYTVDRRGTVELSDTGPGASCSAASPGRASSAPAVGEIVAGLVRTGITH
ncbi:hypothetical protein [Pseudonocardia sp. NPDC046786]|uniref:hypothetical protein n=1 Tax=Pseudonocardia sp. NPDC046786 TaxID=3155471 RepID=UPI0033F55C2A